MNYEESRAYIRAAELKKGIVLGLFKRFQTDGRACIARYG